MTMNKEQEIPEVRLRAMEPEDLDLLYKVENDTSLWGVGVTNVPYSRYTLHEYIANTVGDIYTDKHVRLIIDNTQGETVGIVDITDFDPRHQRAELGIVVQRGHRRKGYATAAVRRAINYARDILHLHQMYVYVDSNNAPSLAFFRNVGFKTTATLKDWLFMNKEYRNAELMQYFL